MTKNEHFTSEQTADFWRETPPIPMREVIQRGRAFRAQLGSFASQAAEIFVPTQADSPETLAAVA